MGDTKSSYNPKITNQLPPSYDEIQIKEIEKVNPLAPITPEFIKANYELFKTKHKLFKANQLAEYEKMQQIAEKKIIINLNREIQKHLTHKYATYTTHISMTDSTRYVRHQYKSDKLDELYLRKQIDFIYKMYSGFEINLLTDLPTYKMFKISVKSN
jgi:putative cell wall-binding protein